MACPNKVLKDFLALQEDEKKLMTHFHATSKKIISNLEEKKNLLAKYSHDAIKHSIVMLAHLEKSIREEETGLNKIISNIDLGLLIRAALTDPEIDKICKHPAVNALWEERWRKCGRNPREAAAINSLPIVEYKPQQTLHTFDLLKSIFIYSKYKTILKNNKNNAMDYLKLAAQLGHFAALNILTTTYMEKSENLNEALTYAQTAAHLYWTPGYLLLTAFFYNQGQYQEALLSLMIAEKLLPYSDNMITNAYQGKNLLTIISPWMSELKVSNWNEVKLALAECANLPAHFVTNVLDAKATKQVNEILASVSRVDLDERKEAEAAEDMHRAVYF